MSVPVATFKVQDVFHITGRTSTYVAGKIESGEVRAGMYLKILVDRGVFMSAKITAIELVRDQSRRSNVALVLETPNDVLRAAWKRIPRPGDILAIDTEAEANQLTEPTRGARDSA